MTWAIFITAFSLGLLSSFHCVGMCGAIAFSLPTQHLKGLRKTTGILLYNLGRISNYTLLGVLFGLLGRQIYLAGFQQWFSIIAGIFILMMVIQAAYNRPVFHLPGFNKAQMWVQKVIARFITSPSISSMFLLGMANGLLPCGLVYLSITGALAAGTIPGAAGFMASFGLGTFPALFLLSYFGFKINLSTRNRIKKAVPYFVGCMGVLLILRGLNLDIPFISPFITTQGAAVQCH